MLNVRCVTAGNWWSLIVGRTRFCIARLSCLWLHARTQFGPTFDRMLLCHNLFALNTSLLISSSTRSLEKKTKSYLYFSRKVVDHTLNTLTIHRLPIERDNREHYNIVVLMVVAAGTYCSEQPLYFPRLSSLRECIEPKGLSRFSVNCIAFFQ